MQNNIFKEGEDAILNLRNLDKIIKFLEDFLLNKTFEISYVNIDGRAEKRIIKTVKHVSNLKSYLGKLILIKLDGGGILQLFFEDRIIFRLVSEVQLEVIERKTPYRYKFKLVK